MTIIVLRCIIFLILQNHVAEVCTNQYKPSLTNHTYGCQSILHCFKPLGIDSNAETSKDDQCSLMEYNTIRIINTT